MDIKTLVRHNTYMLDTHNSRELFCCFGCGYLVEKGWCAGKGEVAESPRSPRSKYGDRVDNYCVKCVNKYDK